MKKLILSLISSATLLSLPIAAEAQDLNWGQPRVSGFGSNPCFYNPDDEFGSNVFFDAYDDVASLIFLDFGLDLDAATDLEAPLRDRQNCRITLDLSIPRGKALVNMQQAVIAGVYKTAGASGRLQTKALMFHDRIALNSLDVNLPERRLIDSPLSIWESTHNFAYRDLYSQCLATRDRPLRTRFQFEVDLYGNKRTSGEAFIVNFDSSDLTFRVTPQLRDCREILRNPPRPERPRPVPSPLPNQPNEPEDPEIDVPDSEAPEVRPGSDGVRIVALRTTSYLPDGSGRCTITKGQGIYLAAAPNGTGWQKVFLERRPNHCTSTAVALQGKLNLKDFRIP